MRSKLPVIVDYPAVSKSEWHRWDCAACTTTAGRLGFRMALRPRSSDGSDRTILPYAPRRWLTHVRFAAPYEQTLADLTVRAWEALLPGPAWVMPKSNWAIRVGLWQQGLDAAGAAQLGIDPSVLLHHTNAPAIEFATTEREHFREFHSNASAKPDGQRLRLAWPTHRVTCTLHHHKQLWWVTDQAAILDGLDRVFGSELLAEYFSTRRTETRRVHWKGSFIG